MCERVGEAGERLVEARHRGTDRAARRRGGRAGRERDAVDERDELDGMVTAVDLDGAGRRGRQRCDAAARSAASGRPTSACSIASTCISTVPAASAGLPTLRTNEPPSVSSRKLRSRSPSSGVASPSRPKTERAISAASVGRDVGRTRFEDVVAHGAPRYRGLRHGRACALLPPPLSARWRPSRPRTAPPPWSPSARASSSCRR